MFPHFPRLPWRREPFRLAAAFAIGLGAAWAAMLPIMIFVRFANIPRMSPLDAITTTISLGMILLMASPAIFLATLPSALWGVAILRRRLPSVPAADFGVGVLLAMILTAFFYTPRGLLGGPTPVDWRTMGYVFVTCTAYFSAGFHAFRRLGGINARGAVPELLSDGRRAGRTAAETALGVIAIGWTGTLLALLHALSMIHPPPN